MFIIIITITIVVVVTIIIIVIIIIIKLTGHSANNIVVELHGGSAHAIK